MDITQRRPAIGTMDPVILYLARTARAGLEDGWLRGLGYQGRRRRRGLRNDWLLRAHHPLHQEDPSKDQQTQETQANQPSEDSPNGKKPMYGRRIIRPYGYGGNSFRGKSCRGIYPRGISRRH